MKKILFTLILSVAVLTPQSTYALFSPALVNQMAPIRQHIAAARKLNGTGSPVNALQKIQGYPGLYVDYQNQAMADNLTDSLSNYADTLSLIFNRLPAQSENDHAKTVTSCLRDDIFELDRFREAVLREALRSALFLNYDHATTLWEDYRTLRALLKTLKTKYTDTPFFFPEGQRNYYLDAECPTGGFFGEFTIAFHELKNTWEVLKTLGTGQNTKLGQWGSIWEMAKARAKVRAAQWIAANQITFTLGGEKGGNGNSLIKGQGFEGGIGALFRVEWQTLKSIIGPITPLFDPSLYKTVVEAVGVGLGADPKILADNICVFYYPDENAWRACTDEQEKLFKKGECNRCRNSVETRSAYDIARELQNQLNAKQTELTQARTALTFNLEFNSLTDQSTTILKNQLFLINTEIRRASEAFGERAGKALPTLCRTTSVILKKHCPNKGGDIPACR